MRCPHCHTANAADARFCQHCAAALRLTCSACGRELAPGARFCDQCATPVDTVPRITRPDGHCIVQRGTKHAWVNRGDVPCVLAAILVNADSVYPK